MSLLNRNWNSLIKPSKEILVGKDSENTATIVVAPLEKGFGLTLGNALRRVLLSSLQGAAITAVKIPGVLHEFSAKQGVKEDIADVLLNLKLVRVKMHSPEERIVRVKAKGPCVVTASMIEVVEGVEVLNPDQEICTLSKDSELEMELYCNVGRGYIPAYEKTKEYPLGVIAIDGIFFPVKKVSYKVEDTRVGQNTDYDKLVMNVETDGSISPEMAVALSARILQDQFQLFVTFEDEQEEKPEVEEQLAYNPILLKKVDELELSVRSRNCLQNDNVVYIGDLVIKSESEMLRTPNFGRKSLNEIKEVLARYSLKFGMEVNNWPPENIEELSKKHNEVY